MTKPGGHLLGDRRVGPGGGVELGEAAAALASAKRRDNRLLVAEAAVDGHAADVGAAGHRVHRQVLHSGRGGKLERGVEDAVADGVVGRLGVGADRVGEQGERLDRHLVRRLHLDGRYETEHYAATGMRDGEAASPRAIASCRQRR